VSVVILCVSSAPSVAMGCGCGKATAADSPGGPATGGSAPPSGGSAPSKDILAKKVQQAKSTRVLALRECCLKKLPAEVISADGSTFKTVDLSINALTSLHEAVGGWSSLQNLLCPQNALTELPSAIGKLENMQKLVLSTNKLRILPMELATLGKLKILLLDSNKLGPILPDVFAGPIAEALEELDISGNALKELPQSLGGLRRLNRLLMPNNDLTALPESLAGMEQLRHLDAANNQLSTVSSSLLVAWIGLSEMWLKGNPIDRLQLQALPGFDGFLARRKQRLDAKIDQNVVGQVSLAVCGLD